MDVQTAKRRAALRREILHLSGVPFYGPTPATYAVVGEAPGRKEVEVGQPFIGPAGKLLRRLMVEVGLNPEAAFWTNTVSWLPEHKTPTKQEVIFQRPLLDRQLLLSQAPFVLLAGATALSAFRHDLKITSVRGKPFWQRGVVFLPIYHPAAALREVTRIGDIREDLTMFRALVELGTSFGQLWPAQCIVCAGELAYYDEDGVGYCKMHRPESQQLTLVDQHFVAT